MAIESIPRATNIFIWHILLIFSFICITAAIMGIPLRNPPANAANINRTDQQRLLEGDEDELGVESGEEQEVLEMRQWKTSY